MTDHSGHRKRIIAKLDKNVLLEHELLEIFLFNAIPRRNTNDIAHRLLARFKSIRGVLDASVAELKTVEGVGENVAAYLVTAGAFFKKYYGMPPGEYRKTLSRE
jgi:DNA repair protein RadC